MKTSELMGKALCYAVCILEMPHLVWGESIGIHEHSDQIVVPNLPSPDCYSPYSDWKMCGPIIERESIYVQPYGEEWVCGETALLDSTDGLGPWDYRGPTTLIAAMRCYVASKLGNEVDIPKELYE